MRVSEARYITVEAARRGCAEIALKGKIRVILLSGKLCRKLLRPVLSSQQSDGHSRETAGDNPEEGGDDVKSSCPLCPGLHT